MSLLKITLTKHESWVNIIVTYFQITTQTRAPPSTALLLIAEKLLGRSFWHHQPSQPSCQPPNKGDMQINLIYAGGTSAPLCMCLRLRAASIGTLIYFQLSVRFMTVLQFNSHLLHELVARAGEDRDRRRHQVSILQCALWLTCVCRKDRKTCCWLEAPFLCTVINIEQIIMR